MLRRNAIGNASAFQQLLVRRSIQWNICQSRTKLSYPLIQHLTENHFIKSYGQTKESQESFYEMNILGNVLVKNWEAEWWKSVRKCNRLTPVGRNLNFTKSENSKICSMIFEHLQDNIPVHGDVAMSADITEPDSKTRRMLVIMKRQSSAGEGYDFEFDQLGFLKKFFNKPSRLRVANGNAQIMNNSHGIIYETDSEVLRIQDVELYSDSKSVTCSGAVYLLDMEQLFLATVVDALGNRNGRIILKLSPRLAPIKIVVQAEPTIAAELVQEFCVMVRSWNIICWNGAEKNMGAVEADSLGVPFMVTLSNEVEKNGLLYLRSLDTSIEMVVHISHLASTLQRYLAAT